MKEIRSNCCNSTVHSDIVVLICDYCDKPCSVHEVEVEEKNCMNCDIWAGRGGMNRCLGYEDDRICYHWKPQAQPLSQGWPEIEKEFDEKIFFCPDDNKYLKSISNNIKSFLREKLAEAERNAIKEYDELLCLEHNCKEMDRVEQYFKGFKDTVKLSEIRRIYLEKRGLK
jgi:hypothetical protein